MIETLTLNSGGLRGTWFLSPKKLQRVPARRQREHGLCLTPAEVPVIMVGWDDCICGGAIF